MAVDRRPAAEPASWGELCNSYRGSWGGGALATVLHPAAARQLRFARSVPTQCPLAETRHPLYATGEELHVPNEADGSLYRSARHGWGDASLLYHSPGLAATPHPSAGPPPRRGLRAAAPPAAKDGRASLFGALSGAEAGGVDAWLGNELIDPTKGRRAAAPPRDPKGRRGLAEVLSLAAPGRPEDDAWLGCAGHDPARGKGRVPDPASRRGRRGLFQVLQPDRPPAPWERGGGGGGGGGGAGAGAAEPGGALGEAAAAADGGAGRGGRGGGGRRGDGPLLQDAWIGNRGIDPRGGKRGASAGGGGGGRPAAAEEHLWGATFRSAPPPEGGAWCDLPRIGKRPLPEPAAASGAVGARHALRQAEPLPPGVALPDPRAKGKRILGEGRRPGSVDVFSLLRFKDLSAPVTGGGGGGEAARWARAWNDAPRQPRRGAAGAGGGGARGGGAAGPGLLAWAPNRAARFVPFGGLAQEHGMNLNDVAAIAAIARKGGGTMPAARPGGKTAAGAPAAAAAAAGQARGSGKGKGASTR
ncbi:hypothetical protein Rsub_05695 [Raphidocelis subcapitata]|uniref:Uncharacterized protein n=1 Tax=Raphidocelis subcapitata TaxID=307507 RepID=A0A2V0NZN0_9CHLO|nr:hypothetical protein Rsub_05695 [Raphidocelis subcapitata]|eukprot:GBF93084.1 hypothetical protein Rsub_05695 [Raphidocelis subcapitata]